MPAFDHSQLAFNTGELSPQAAARSDIDRYAHGVDTMENFIPLVEGAAEKRPGTKFIARAVRDDKRSILIPFEYSVDQAYVMEFAEGTIRIFRDEALLLDGNETGAFTGLTDGTPVVVSATNTLTNGELVFIVGSAQAEINGRYFRVSNQGAGTFALEVDDTTSENGFGRATGAGGSAFRVFEMEGPYLEADLHKIQIRQQADVVYVTCPGYRPAKIVRVSDTVALRDWTYTPMRWGYILDVEAAVDIPSTDIAATNPVRITLTGHPLATNDIVYFWNAKMAELNDRHFKVIKIDADNFDLLGEDGTSRTITPDVVFQTKLWEVDISPSRKHAPPFAPLQGSTVTMTFNGTNQIVASKAIFLPEHSGAYVKIEETANVPSWGYVFILDFITVATTTVAVEVVQNNPIPPAMTGVATRDWAFEAFGEHSGFPGAIAFYQTRLWLGSAQSMWASRTFNFDNFINYDSLAGPAALTDVDGLLFEINQAKLNAIQWFSGNNPLLIGTNGSEFRMQGIDPDAQISNTNLAEPQRVSTYGSSEVPPVEADSGTLFAQRGGKKLREFLYSFGEDSYTAANMMRLARHISKSAIRQMAFQPQPNRILWVVFEDGTLASFVYEKEERVAGWSRHIIGGTQATVESVSVIPRVSDDTYDVWLVVRRKVGAVFHRHVELMTDTWELVNDKLKPHFLDCAVRYDDVATTTVNGVNHFIGETLSIVADGLIVPDQVVSDNGTLTLDDAAKVITAGLPYRSKIRSLDIEPRDDNGASQGTTKRIISVVLLLWETGAGLFVGDRFGDNPTDMAEIHETSLDDFGSGAIDLFNGKTDRQVIEAEHDRSARLCIEHRLPFPCTVVSSYTKLDLGEGG